MSEELDADREFANLDADRQQITQELENIGIDQEQFEEIYEEFRQFLNEIIGNANLERFAKAYKRIYNTLKTSYEGERRLVKRCKELNSQIYEKATNVRAAIRIASNEANKIGALKEKVDQAYGEVEVARQKEAQTKEKVQKLKLEIASLKREAQQESNLEEDQKLRELRREFEERLKVKEEQDERAAQVRLISNELNERMKTCDSDIEKVSQDIEKKHKEIADTKALAKDKAAYHQTLKEQMKSTKAEIETQKKLQAQKQEEKQKNSQENQRLKRTADELENKIQDRKDTEGHLNNEKKSLHKKLNEMTQKYDNSMTAKGTKMQSKEDLEREVLELEKENKKATKAKNTLRKMLEELQATKSEKDIERNNFKTDLTLKEVEMERIKKKVDALKKEIDENMRSRDVANKNYVESQEKVRKAVNDKQTLDNELKKVENKITGYKMEAEKLNNLMLQLDKDKEKYSVEATKANANYYQCLEQVKLKNNLITKLQKKNIEAEGRLKQQQNLYEAVRSDRNLYSKNLLEAQEEIAELKMKFKVMIQSIDQLKEEISTKDHQIHLEDIKKRDLEKQNTENRSNIAQKEKLIKSSEEWIKSQEEDCARLKYVISEAESEKQKQKKDYEMVINERDILGTQLIKRNEELELLYEKIKIQKSTLKKGETYYQERCQDIALCKKKIAELKSELIVSQKESACIPDLRKEIHNLEKELLEQQQKEKLLNDELEKPMNVHRWRKLECTDHDTYEMIQKIQSLQKRLIAKTEEVQEKDVLIQEKEKLYIELKNILAKQSGPEVAEKLQVYQQNLKERSKQLKDMIGELKNYQSQCNAYKFEIERLDKEISIQKQTYFQARKNGTLQPIMEENEDINENQQQQQQQQLMMMQQQQQQLNNAIMASNQGMTEDQMADFQNNLAAMQQQMQAQLQQLTPEQQQQFMMIQQQQMADYQQQQMLLMQQQQQQQQQMQQDTLPVEQQPDSQLQQQQEEAPEEAKEETQQPVQEQAEEEQQE